MLGILTAAKGSFSGACMDVIGTIDESAGHVTHHADSYLTFTFPADGNYVVQILDAQGFGGDEYGYRLVVAPPQPDYILRIRPDNLRTAQGSMAFASVNVFRRDRFTGEINLSMRLPKE